MSIKLYVGNVPERAQEKDLKELFEAFGTVEEVAMLRGYGFVVSAIKKCALFRNLYIAPFEAYALSCLYVYIVILIR